MLQVPDTGTLLASESTGAFSRSWLLFSSRYLLMMASSSATNDVVTLTRGYMQTLDTWLNIAIETPTAAISTEPDHRSIVHRFIELNFRSQQLNSYMEQTNKTIFRNLLKHTKENDNRAY